MSDGNGGDTIQSFFQSKKDMPYDGEELRDKTIRVELSPVEQLLIDFMRELREDVKEIKGCKDDCNLGELTPLVGRSVTILKEKGKGQGIEQGLENFRDESQQVEKILSTRSKIIERAILILVGIGIMYTAKRIGWV